MLEYQKFLRQCYPWYSQVKKCSEFRNIRKNNCYEKYKLLGDIEENPGPANIGMMKTEKEGETTIGMITRSKKKKED